MHNPYFHSAEPHLENNVLDNYVMNFIIYALNQVLFGLPTQEWGSCDICDQYVACNILIMKYLNARCLALHSFIIYSIYTSLVAGQNTVPYAWLKRHMKKSECHQKSPNDLGCTKSQWNVLINSAKSIPTLSNLEMTLMPF